MRVVIFFACLFYLLFGGYNYVYTSTGNNNFCSAQTQNIAKPQQTKFTNANRDDAIIQDIDLDKEEEYLISEDVEDEDVNNSFPASYKIAAHSYATDSYQSILSYLYYCFNTPLSFCGSISYRYILQGALRI